jgi:tRNA 2-thiouridine synthesizing protein A
LGYAFTKEKKMTIAPKISLDFKGLCCPMPVVKIEQVVKQVQIGEVVEGVATDPAVMADIPAWARKTGNEVVCLEKREKDFHFIIRRVK